MLSYNGTRISLPRPTASSAGTALLIKSIAPCCRIIVVGFIVVGFIVAAFGPGLLSQTFILRWFFQPNHIIVLRVNVWLFFKIPKAFFKIPKALPFTLMKRRKDYP